MSTLQTITPETATGEVAEIYAQIKNAWGHVPTAIQVFSANPFLLRHQWAYYSSVMQHPTLVLSADRVYPDAGVAGRQLRLLHRHERGDADQHGRLDA